MEDILKDLNKSSSGIIGSLLVGPDGIPIAADFSSPMNDEMIAALVSSITNAANKVIQKLTQEEMQSFIIETDTNKIFLQNSSMGYLVTLANNDANLGLVRVEIKSAAQRLNQKG